MYRLYPTTKQAEQLIWILDRCRELYNAALEERREAYRMAGKSLKWYVTLTCEAAALPLPQTGESVGLDLGLADFLVTETGAKVANPRPLRRAAAGLTRAQQALSRQKRGSQRRRKQRLRVAKQHRKVANVRRDFHHKTARALVQRYDTIRHGRLAVRNMVQNHCLAESIGDAAWAPFIAILTAKAAEAGRVTIAVNPRNASQTCVCGEPVPKDLGDRWHVCHRCQLSLPRDQVSAMIIKGIGLSLQAHAA